MESPVITGVTPIPESFVSDIYPVVEFNLEDFGSGFITDSVEICISVTGIPTRCFDITDTGISHTGSHFSADLTELGFSLTGGNTVRVCVNTNDTPDICSPNELDTCWTFYIPAGGPIASEITPRNGTFTACPDQSILIRVMDAASDPIDESSIVLEVSGITYTIDDPELSFRSPDTIAFVPSTDFSDGEIVTVRLLACSDILGNELSDAPFVLNFRVDLSAPFISAFSPAATSGVRDLCPTVSFNLTDALSGLNTSSVSIVVNGISLTLTSPSVTWISGICTINLCAAGLDLSGGDTIRIRINASDRPDYCAPNTLDTLLWFYIPAGGPVGTLITPFAGIFTSCDPQEIRIRITDPEGDAINDSTVSINVNGVVYHLSDPELFWRGDTLVFNGGTSFFADGDVVTVTLLSASDVLRNPLSATVTTTFTVDLDPPVPVLLYPAHSSSISDISPLISFLLTDDVSGLDHSSVSLRVDGVTYHLSDPALYMRGDTLFFDPDSVSLSWAGGDLVNLVISAHDSITPGYCSPNDTTIAYSFSVSSGGPVGEIITPTADTYVACNPVQIKIHLYDPEGDPLDLSSIVLSVNSVLYDLSSPELSLVLDTLIFDATLDFFTDGSLVNVELISCDDVLHNGLSVPLFWSFTVDYSPPVFSSESPLNGSAVTDLEPDISIVINDHLSGVDATSITLSVEGILYRNGDTGTYWDGTSFTLRSSEIGLSWLGGDVIDCIVSAGDSPDYCSANTGSFTWSFYIPSGGPVPSVIQPRNLSISSCPDQVIMLLLTDPDGVDPSSIILIVEGISYTVDDTELSFSGDTIYFAPSFGFYTDGQIVNVTLSENTDLLGNRGDLLPFSWSITMDLEGPQYSNETPSNLSNFSSSSFWQTPISIEVTDNVTGVWDDSITISVSGIYRSLSPILINSSDPSLSFSSGTLSFNPALLDAPIHGISYASYEDSLTGTGVYFPEFSTIELTVTAKIIHPITAMNTQQVFHGISPFQTMTQ
jgi:hypothetical protein